MCSGCRRSRDPFSGLSGKTSSPSFLAQHYLLVMLYSCGSQTLSDKRRVINSLFIELVLHDEIHVHVQVRE